MIHYKDILSRKPDCGSDGESTLELWDVDCSECLELMKKEWERQVEDFDGSARTNALRGLQRTKIRINELKFVKGKKEKNKNVKPN